MKKFGVNLQKKNKEEPIVIKEENALSGWPVSE